MYCLELAFQAHFFLQLLPSASLFLLCTFSFLSCPRLKLPGMPQSHRRENLKENRGPLWEWYERHRFAPYPTKQQKRMLCGVTGLNMAQVNDFFSNQRRREKKRVRDMGLNQSFAMKKGAVTTGPPATIEESCGRLVSDE